MIQILGVVLVLGILFALCKYQEQSMDAERVYWIRNHELLKNSQHDH